MNAIEAIVYCLGYVHAEPEDGEYRSQTAYDSLGDPHWIAWEVSKGKLACPRFCSGSPTPFTEDLGPYGVNHNGQKA